MKSGGYRMKLKIRLAACMLAAAAMLQLISCGSGDAGNETTAVTETANNTEETASEDTADDTLGESVTQGDAASSFMDCISSMSIISALSTDIWGADEVGARDTSNGLEDDDMSDYSYWDGGIIRDEETGTYYLFASRWDQSLGFDGWYQSKAVYATSYSLEGPYTDMGLLWEDEYEGVGHNVFPFEISESDPLYEEGYRYAIIISDVGTHSNEMNGVFHVAKSLDGEWERLSKMSVSGGDGFSLSNISIVVRADGTYEAVNRDGDIATAASLSDTWEVYANDIWENINGLPLDTSCIEDPVIWYSGGIYHIVANRWDTKEAYYMTSEDGLTGWVRHSGYAYTPSETFLTYEDGTENHWSIIERPNVYIEDGKVAAMTFAVINTEKDSDGANDDNGSKIIVVPFDGEMLEKFDETDVYVSATAGRDGILPIADSAVQSWDTESEKNYGGDKYLQVQRNTSQGIFGEGEKTDEWYDCKIAFIKFDISDYINDEDGELESAYLSLVYLYQASGDSSTDRLRAALASSDWIEGTGVEIGSGANGNYAANGDLIWSLQPEIYYDEDDIEGTTAVSDAFDTSEGNSEILIDVTNLINLFREMFPGETEITFAICETSGGNRLRIGSREAGDDYAPKLSITVRTEE